MDDQNEHLTWRGMNPAMKWGLAAAAGIVVVPVALLLIWMFVAGFSERSFTHNLHYGVLLIWIPILVGLGLLQHDRFWGWCPAVKPVHRETALTILSFSLVFSVMGVTDDMSRGEMVREFALSFLFLICAFTVINVAGALVLKLWRRRRSKSG